MLKAETCAAEFFYFIRISGKHVAIEGKIKIRTIKTKSAIKKGTIFRKTSIESTLAAIATTKQAIPIGGVNAPTAAINTRTMHRA